MPRTAGSGFHHVLSSCAFAVLVFGAACAQRTPATNASAVAPIDTMALREHTSVLAHDSMRGRGTGTSGARAAAGYIAGRLRDLGLDPLGADDASADPSFLLPVPLLRADVSAATLTVGPLVAPNGAGFVVGRVGRDGLSAAAGPVQPLGPDSSDVAAGSWLLLDASPGEAALRWLPEWKRRGVIGLIIRLPGDAAVAGWHAHLGDERWLLAEGPPDPIWQPGLPVVMVGPALVDELLEPGARAAFEPNARTQAVTDFNVVGVLEGARPDAAPVFLTAHYDHLGVRSGSGGDTIYNGFSDNAAGVAMLLTIARSARAAPPPRPLIFLFTAAEEVGLLGSIHFVRTHEQLVRGAHALVNLDAGAPPAPPTRWRLAGATRSPAGAVAAAVVDAHGWAHRSDAGSPNSDHWPFMMRGVPSIFLIPDGGFEGVTEAQARALVERWDRYHQPGDEFAADFPFAGLRRYAALGRDIAYALARADLTP